MSSFPDLFNQEDEEGEDGEESNRPIQKGGLVQFGILPYILTYCNATNEKLSDALEQPINLVLYVMTFEYYKHKEEEKKIKEIQNRR